MTEITLQGGKVVMRGSAVGTGHGCCCDEAGYCCVSGECDPQYTTQAACERCDPVLDQFGDIIDFSGPCGTWIKGANDCGANPWKCNSLPQDVCINGLPAEWDDLKQLSGGQFGYSHSGSPTNQLYIQPFCGRWKIIGVISRFDVPDVIGFSAVLPTTPDGQCFPASAEITITSDRNSPGFPQTVTITIDPGMC